jgi:hypothetical protein
MLVGMAAGLVVAHVHNLVPGADRRRSAELVCSVVALCRQQAVADSDVYTIGLDLRMNRLAVSRFAAARDEPPGEFFLPRGAGFREVRVGGRRVSGRDARLVVTPTGVVTPFVAVVGNRDAALMVVSDGLSEEVVDAPTETPSPGPDAH